MLALLSWIYGTVTGLRNRLYDQGVLKTHGLGSRVISIGNITAGGTGKTPLVLHVAQAAAARGEKVCILTRGYGRRDPKQRVLVSDGKEILSDPTTAGDEPYELARRLQGEAIIIADKNRVAAARWAKEQFAVSLFILDDGFQHRRVLRDVDIVCVDATQPFADGQMLPAGRLREHQIHLSRADAVIITRSDTSAELESLAGEIAELAPSAAIFYARARVSLVRALEQFKSNESTVAEGLNGKKVLAFCGLGNPDNFFSTIEAAGAALVESRSFPDHHLYTQQNADELVRDAVTSGAEALVTTAKDAVKLISLRFEMPCLVVEVQMEIDDTARFHTVIWP